ncbi:hypothetical protein MMC16_006104 [Acarospora aff. strigata]|nr:hypothetical protein [Acarospora aff. strigata]
MAVAFVVCSYRKNKNVAAVLEWVVALIFTFYVFAYFIDLLPAVRTKHHRGSGPQLELESNSGGAHLTNGHDRTATNGEYGYANGNHTNGTQVYGIQDSTVASRYYGNGTTHVKPASAQNF